MESLSDRKPVWSFETHCPFPIKTIEAVVFDLQKDSHKKPAQSFLLAGKSGYTISDEDNGILVLFTDGQSGRIYANLQKDLVIIEGEWWYHGEFHFSQAGGGTAITLKVFNVAKKLKWLASLMILPDKEKHRASLKDFSDRIALRLKSVELSVPVKKHRYLVKKAGELTDLEISTILDQWAIREWKGFRPEVFKMKFSGSEFHLLYSDQNNLLSLARINFKFSINLNNKPWQFAELVGLVSVVKKKGFARQLLKEIRTNLYSRNIQSIGFCASDLREFYRKCGIEILPGKAKYLLEKQDENWVESEDDDILLINVTGEYRAVLEKLASELPGYLDFS